MDTERHPNNIRKENGLTFRDPNKAKGINKENN